MRDRVAVRDLPSSPGASRNWNARESLRESRDNNHEIVAERIDDGKASRRVEIGAVLEPRECQVASKASKRMELDSGPGARSEFGNKIASRRIFLMPLLRHKQTHGHVTTMRSEHVRFQRLWDILCRCEYCGSGNLFCFLQPLLC